MLIRSFKTRSTIFEKFKLIMSYKSSKEFLFSVYLLCLVTSQKSESRV